MAREPKCRKVAFEPLVNCFFPLGVPASPAEEVFLKIEELEAIRLKDYLALDQEDGAAMMGVSRPTFQRIVSEAHQKIADALITGKIIRIEGGNYCLGGSFCRKDSRHLEQNEECQFADVLTSSITDEKPKVAFCASGAGSEAHLAEHFGRCSFYWVWSTDEQTFTVVPNHESSQGHSKGLDAVRRLASEGVSIIITRKIGPRAFFAMQRLGMKIYADPDESLIHQSLQKYLNQELEELSEPSFDLYR